MTPYDFIEYWARILADIAPRHGIQIISAPLAQTIIESGWGKSSLAILGHNCWGIKAGTSWTGDTLTLNTSEEEGGQTIQIKDRFRKYASDEAGAEDYFTLMDLPRYAAVKSAKSAREYLTAIRAAGYCTSSSYVDSCMKIVDQYGLTRFDHKEDYSMDFTQYAGMISNSGSDERGKISGGQAGDQTGGEWRIRTWYDRPWNCVLRHPDPRVRQKLAELSVKAAQNDHIGYDQNQRLSYWEQLQLNGYDPSKIFEDCEADCSAGVIANTRAVGRILGLSALDEIEATYTGNMREAYRKAGFTVLTDQKYLFGWKYLETGDILLNDIHHVCVYVGPGTAPASAPAPAAPGPDQAGAGTDVSNFKKVQAATLTKASDARSMVLALKKIGIRSYFYKKNDYYLVGCGSWPETVASDLLDELKKHGITGIIW